MIPYGRQEVTDEDIKSVIDVLKSDFLTQGPQVPIFEDKVKNFCNAKHAVASNSATSSLHAACFALGVSKNDIVWTSANTFAASSNCAIYCGAHVDFVDIDPRTYNICSIKLESKLKNAKSKGKLPKVLIVVHLGGEPCDMKEIQKICKKYNLILLEDTCESMGAKYNKRYLGGFGLASTFSFYFSHHITCLEGGVTVTNDFEFAEIMKIIRSHGWIRDIKEKKKWISKFPEINPNFLFVNEGYNLRLTEPQARMGITQIKKLDSYVKKRRKNAKFLLFMMQEFNDYFVYQNENFIAAVPPFGASHTPVDLMSLLWQTPMLRW